MPPRICVIHCPCVVSSTRPTQPARPSEKLRAVVQGVYPSFWMTLPTRMRTSALAYPPLITRETVLFDTRAWRATSAMSVRLETARPLPKSFADHTTGRPWGRAGRSFRSSPLTRAARPDPPAGLGGPFLSSAAVGGDQVVGPRLAGHLDGLVDVPHRFFGTMSAVSDLRELGKNSSSVGTTRPCQVERLAQNALCIGVVAAPRKGGTELSRKDDDGAQRIVELAAGDLFTRHFEAAPEGQRLAVDVAPKCCTLGDLLEQEQ